MGERFAGTGKPQVLRFRLAQKRTNHRFGMSAFVEESRLGTLEWCF
jgi:hypothetical protein